MGLMLVGLVVLYILHFTSNRKPITPAANTNIANTQMQEGGLRIAYVNTDTLLSQYQLAKDLEKELQSYQASKEKNYKSLMEKFQNDYNNYLQTGADLTRSQQEAKESELKSRMEKLQNLEGEYALQIQQRTLSESEKMTQNVYDYIKSYCEENGFDLVLAKSFTSSPVLYGNEGLDITQPIVEGLNKAYAESKK